jgi:DNA-binding MarR family transcriptional regulator
MAISSLLDRMQAAGLIERRNVQSDRRMRALFLTENGANLVRKMNKVAASVLQEVFAGTSTGDRDQLRSLLGIIKNNANRIRK